MLYFKLEGYEDFKKIFGTKNSDRGCIANKILLSFWMHRFKLDKNGSASQIKTMSDLYNLIMNSLNGYDPDYQWFQDSTSVTNYPDGSWERVIRHKLQRTSPNLSLTFNDNYFSFFCQSYKGQINFSPCPGQLVVTNIKNGHLESIKAGKLMRMILNDNRVKIGEPTEVWVCEEFQRKIEAASKFDESKYTFHLDKNFEEIYSSSACSGDFGSCMTNKKRHSFYLECLDANAAYITRNSDGKIIARCIVYNNVYTSDGKVHRYADRIYGDSEVSRRILVSAIAQKSDVDLFKVVGAGCRDIEQITDKNGIKISDTRVAINCYIPNGHIMSFMDTFKFYDITNHIACNTSRMNLDFDHIIEIDHTNENISYSCRTKKLNSIDEITSRSLLDFFKK